MLTKNIIWLGIERSVQLVSTIAISSILLNKLAMDEYNSWQYGFTFIGIINITTWFLGTELLTPILLQKNSAHNADKIISYFFKAKLIFCFILYIATLIAISFVSDVIR
jgi:O-antigen/teichoic acid export membrane protein